MEEMKNPTQQTNGLTAQALIAIVLIVFGFFWIQQIHHQRAAPEPYAKASAPAVPSKAVALQASSPTDKFELLAKPFFAALYWIHGHLVRNWGAAILLLTLGINIAVLPLRIKAMRSQRKIQQIQPQIAAIRERYKDSPFGSPEMQQMNQEIADLHRASGVSVFGGIVPSLMQMPLFYGIYRMLHEAGELHHASWLWLHDLSAADPLHVLPVFLVTTMFLQQFVTPSPGANEAQRKILTFALPAFYGFIAWHLPAGLALYWSLGNVVGIVQQVLFNRTNPCMEEHAIEKTSPWRSIA